MRSKNICGKHTVETRLNTASSQFFQIVLLFSFINTLGVHSEGMGPIRQNSVEERLGWK